MNGSDRLDASGRELFGTRVGFILAAVGSAVGLGNMWRFPYVTAQSGGAAFVVLYLFMTFLIGVPIMLAEFAVGRRTRQAPIGALRQLGGARWVPVGLMLVLTSSLILAYLSVVAGWTVRYALDAAVRGFSENPGDRFAVVSTGGQAIVYYLLSMAAAAVIVMGGVRKGIERASLILMPLLFLLLVGLAVWAATLAGAGPGYAFYLRPSLRAILDPLVLQGAAGQAFYSLSVGMGIMITYASYLSRRENLNREAAVVSLSDFSVAFIAGLVVFPVIFALGLSGEVGESTMGTLFISLPGAFREMGPMGRIVGFAFFLTLTVAALTSAVSLLEVVVASIIDEAGWSRRTATAVAGLAIGLVGLLPAVSQDALAFLDQLAAELMVVAGVFGMAVLVGWVMKHPESELLEGASPAFQPVVPIAVFMIRYLVPPFIAVILWISAKDFVDFVLG